MGFLIHGRHARILARVFGVRSEDRGRGVRGWWVGGEGKKYSFIILEGQKNTVLQERENPCIKNPMSEKSHMLQNPYN